MENTVLGGEQFLKRGHSEVIVKVAVAVAVCLFFKILINIDMGEEGGAGFRGLGLKRGCL